MKLRTAVQRDIYCWKSVTLSENLLPHVQGDSGGTSNLYLKSQKKASKLLLLENWLLNTLTTNVPHYTETSLLIWSANQLTVFYIMGTLVVNELMK